MFCAISVAFIQEYIGTAICLRLILGPIETLTVLLADSVLIYRCWVVYSRNWRVIVLPISLWVAYVGFSGLFLYTSAYKTLSEVPVPYTISRLYQAAIAACYICTIGINTYCTSFIIHRIWRVTRLTTGAASPTSVSFTIQVIAESGLLYTITSILGLIAGMASLGVKNTASRFAAAIFSAINYNMTGIAFNLLLIRVAQKRTSSSPEAYTTGPSIPMFNIRHVSNMTAGSIQSANTKEPDILPNTKV
ncbi:hypothetical protein AMATHDRAFT_68350 [Amanita thiersii Skay4041]|uniref:Uncharacterized protein n=1 Tax=Amanita thiersii Skay4041 TaxID=703135 RepID=A0A2A9NFV2_9AGAR|nr:hypothetical protein AMATHDRAFT_68350 [Amanita thiersii Skay4041]